MKRKICVVFVMLLCQVFSLCSCVNESKKNTTVDGFYFTNGEYDETFERNKKLIISKGYRDIYASEIAEILADAKGSQIIDDIELVDLYETQIKSEYYTDRLNSYIVLITEKGTEYWVFVDHGVVAIYKDAPKGEPFYYVVE